MISSIVCSSKSSAGAGAGDGAGLLLLDPWLLAWNCLGGLNSLKRRALELDEGDLIIYEINVHETMELLVLYVAR